MQYANIVDQERSDNRSSPAILMDAKFATPISTDRSASAVAHPVIVARLPSVRPRNLRRDSAHLLVEVTLETSRTIASTTHPIRARGFIARRRASIGSSTRPNGNGQALDNSIGRALTGPLAGVHAVIVGEVPTYHERFHGCTVGCQVLL